MTHYLSYLSLAAYAASFCCYARILYAPQKSLGRLATLLLAVGLILHYYWLLERSQGTNTVPYDDLYGSMSLFAWLLGITYLGLEIFHRQRSVGAFVTLWLFVWITLLELLAPQAVPLSPPPARGAIFVLHVTLNTWAYAAFALSFILSLVYLGQDRLLRSRRLGSTFWRFPALDVLDRMARSSVYVGLVTFVFGVAMGFMWEHRLTGGYALGDPKVIVTLAILIAYVAYVRLSKCRMARGAGREALRREFPGSSFQLYIREFISHKVPSLPLMPTATKTRSTGAGRIQVVLIGCNHRTAPVEVRERISFTQKQALEAADELRRQGILDEAVVLSTCNRSELYGVPGESRRSLRMRWKHS